MHIVYICRCTYVVCIVDIDVDIDAHVVVERVHYASFLEAPAANARASELPTPVG